MSRPGATPTPQRVGAALALSGVTRRYRTGPDAGVVGVVEVDLRISGGEFVAVMGPSGSGKSTLLNLVAALDRADRGAVVVDGTDLTTADRRTLDRYRRDTVGVVFQDSALVPELSVAANVALPAMLGRGARRRRHRDEVGARVGGLLADLDVADLVDRMPDQLSGGQQQRVAIARALVNRPGLVVADEPTGSLDSRHGQQVIDILATVNRRGATVVVVTHDPTVAARAHRTIRLVDGRVV